MTRFSYTDVGVINTHYPTLDRPSLLALLPGHTWVSVKHKAKSLGISRPNIRTSVLKVLLQPTTLNAYWWGLIMSDGHINDKGSLRVHLHESDRDYLDVFAHYLGVKTRTQAGKMATLEVMDRINGLRLRDFLGITRRKTYECPKQPKFLQNKEMLLAFIIGFIDGDGSLHFDKNRTFKSIKIAVHGSWYIFMKDLAWAASEILGLKFTVSTNGRGNACLYVGTKAVHRDMVGFINRISLPVLHRKWFNKGLGYTS